MTPYNYAIAMLIIRFVFENWEPLAVYTLLVVGVFFSRRSRWPTG